MERVLLIRIRKSIRFYNHHPDHTAREATSSTELEAEPRSLLLPFDLISDTDISAGT